MGEFFNSNIFTKLKGALSQNLTLNEDNAFCNLSEAVNRLKTELLQKSVAVTGFINVLLADDDFMSDSFVQSGVSGSKMVYNITSKFGFSATVWFNDLKNAFESIAVTETIKGVSEKTWTVLTQNGNCIKIAIRDNALVYLNGDANAWGMLLGVFSDSIHLNETIWDLDGNTVCLWDVLHELSLVNQINNMLISLSDLVTGSFDNFQTAFTSVANTYLDSVSTIRDAVRNAISAYSSGGRIGLAKYILNYYAVMTSVEETDGLLHFTDNSALVPKIYLGGVVTLVGTAISVIGNAVVLLAQNVIGVAITAIGAMVSVIGNLFNADLSNTYAQLQSQNPDVQFNGCPLGLFQFRFQLSDWTTNPNFPELLSSGQILVYKVPGGYLLACGDTSADSLTIEFHADLVDRTTRVDSLLTTLFITPSFTDSRVYLDIDTSNGILFQNIISAGAFASNTILSNDSDDSNSALGYLVEDKALCQRILAANMILFALYAFNFDDTGVYRFRTYSEWPGEDATDPVLITGSFPTDADRKLFDLMCWAYTKVHKVVPDADYYVWEESWSGFIQKSLLFAGGNQEEPASELPDFRLISLLLNPEAYYGHVLILTYSPNTSSWLLHLPTIDSLSFWATIIVGATVAIIAVAATAFISYKVVKAVRKKRLENAIRVQNAYETAQKDPTDANIKAYQSAVMKNNLWSKVIGGTVYSKTDYWNGTAEKSSVWSQAWDSFFASGSAGVSSSKTLDDIYLLIKGSLD